MFHPGLSTAEAVTPLSGRGVGMDVVRERVKNLRGRVAVSSELGQGTTISLIVPVSLTRIRCTAAGGDSLFAVPRRWYAYGDHQRDRFRQKGEMVTVNDQPIPLVSLNALLDVPLSAPQEEAIVVLRDRPDGCIEIDLHSEQELVLKSLPKSRGAIAPRGAGHGRRNYRAGRARPIRGDRGNRSAACYPARQKKAQRLRCWW
jgi:two-component system chemotaxis sensor kinase CheA